MSELTGRLIHALGLVPGLVYNPSRVQIWFGWCVDTTGFWGVWVRRLLMYLVNRDAEGSVSETIMQLDVLTEIHEIRKKIHRMKPKERSELMRSAEEIARFLKKATLNTPERK